MKSSALAIAAALRMRSTVLAVAAVLPLVVAEIWTGFRVGLTDPVLAAIAPGEQPLSVRSVVGLWAMLLAVAWFGGVYWHKSVRWWEVALVVLGGAVALARVGNAWVFALLMVMPLARQLSIIQPRAAPLAGVCLLSALSALVSAYVGLTTRPPALPGESEQAAINAHATQNVLADWRWAGALQRQLGSGPHVYGSGGFGSEAPDFWVDYVRIADGHERWADILQTRNVDMLVLDTTQEATAADLVRASSAWRVTYDANNALVAVRSST